MATLPVIIDVFEGRGPVAVCTPNLPPTYLTPWSVSLFAVIRLNGRTTVVVIPPAYDFPNSLQSTLVRQANLNAEQLRNSVVALFVSSDVLQTIKEIISRTYPMEWHDIIEVRVKPSKDLTDKLEVSVPALNGDLAPPIIAKYLGLLGDYINAEASETILKSAGDSGVTSYSLTQLAQGPHLSTRPTRSIKFRDTEDGGHYRCYFKGLDLMEFLRQSKFGEDRLRERVIDLRTLSNRRLDMLSKLAPFQLIDYYIEMPVGVVTVDMFTLSTKQFCGWLYDNPQESNELDGDGSMNDHILKWNRAQERPDWKYKAKLCYMLCKAISFILEKANGYHSDIRPHNCLLRTLRKQGGWSEPSLSVADWEYDGSQACTIAPEANGRMRVSISPETGHMLYEYKEDNSDMYPSINHWPWLNVFHTWSEQPQFKRAIESAYVFSIGRTIWMLLEQMPEVMTQFPTAPPISPGMSFHQVKHCPDWYRHGDIPDDCTKLVERCLEEDPGKRPRLNELLKYFQPFMAEDGAVDAVDTDDGPSA